LCHGFMDERQRERIGSDFLSVDSEYEFRAEISARRTTLRELSAPGIPGVPFPATFFLDLRLSALSAGRLSSVGEVGGVLGDPLGGGFARGDLSSMLFKLLPTVVLDMADLLDNATVEVRRGIAEGKTVHVGIRTVPLDGNGPYDHPTYHLGVRKRRVTQFHNVAQFIGAIRDKRNPAVTDIPYLVSRKRTVLFHTAFNRNTRRVPEKLAALCIVFTHGGKDSRTDQITQVSLLRQIPDAKTCRYDGFTTLERACPQAADSGVRQRGEGTPPPVLN